MKRAICPYESITLNPLQICSHILKHMTAKISGLEVEHQIIKHEFIALYVHFFKGNLLYKYFQRNIYFQNVRLYNNKLKPWVKTICLY